MTTEPHAGRALGSLLILAAALSLPQPPAAAAPGDLGKFFEGYDGCFILTDASNRMQIRYNSPRCHERLAPCSTFKIANSLIGLESGALADENVRLKWDGVKRDPPEWNRDHTLKTAFPASAVWYFQEVARRIGADRMKEYLGKLEYGNRDASGGLTQFWLGSSLKISAEEQVEFVRKLIAGKLPVSERVTGLVKALMVLTRSKPAIFAGKTGTDWDAARRAPTLGWFVGYAVREKGTYVFATNIRGGRSPDGRTARQITEKILAELALP